MNHIANDSFYYPDTNNTPQPVNPVNAAPVDFAGNSLIVNTIYYMAFFALIWSIYYYSVNSYQFKYFTLGKRAKEHANEWRGLDHWVSNYRILWTLLALQFPLVFVFLGKDDLASVLLFGFLFLIMFFLKLFLDATHIFKLKDYTKSFAGLSVGMQIGKIGEFFTKGLSTAASTFAGGGVKKDDKKDDKKGPPKK
ncbi:MAG: hypothetical protein ACRCXZ_01765 [Patescibacteria group bacterium]